jgi:hypothetical protein
MGSLRPNRAENSNEPRNPSLSIYEIEKISKPNPEASSLFFLKEYYENSINSLFHGVAMGDRFDAFHFTQRLSVRFRGTVEDIRLPQLWPGLRPARL